jgi:hypothetical protein
MHLALRTIIAVSLTFGSELAPSAIMLERRQQSAQTCRTTPISVVNSTPVLPILGRSSRWSVSMG